MEEMYVYKNQQKLRWGYTTGTCGTAASMAAALMLFRQKRVSHVKVSTPKGIDLDLGDRGDPFYKGTGGMCCAKGLRG